MKIRGEKEMKHEETILARKEKDKNVKEQEEMGYERKGK